MVDQVGAVEVAIRANLAPYQTGLQEAQRLAQTFSNTVQGVLDRVASSTQRVTAEAEKFVKVEKQATVDTRLLNEAVGTLTGSVQAQLGLLPRLAGLAGIGGVVVAAQQAVQAYGQWEQAQIAFEGRLRSTRGILGITAEEITSLSQTISRATLTPMESLRNFAVELGRTGEVTSGTLQRALHILPDLTLRVGDFGRASQILTQALKDPSQAVALLRDAGVQFTATQRTLLENTDGLAQRLQNAGEVMGILESQIGGEAAARERGVVGGFARLADAVATFTVNLGGAIDRTFRLSEGARNLGSAIHSLNDTLFPSNEWNTRIETAKRQLADIQRQLAEIRAEAPPGAPVGGPPRLPPMGMGQYGMPQPLSQEMLEVLRRVTAGGGVPNARTAQELTLEQAAAAQRLRIELLEIGQAYQASDQAGQEASRTLEEQEEIRRGLIKAVEDQIEALDGENRANQMAIQAVKGRGLTEDDPIVSQLTRLYQDFIDARRRLAQSDQLSVFDRENKRLKDQIELFQHSNEEMRIRAQLNRIVQAAERARQPLTDAQKGKIEDSIRLLERVQTLTSTVNSAFSSVFNSMGDALAEFAATGKFEFKQLADSIIRNLVRIATQAFIIQPIMNAITGFTNPAIAGAMRAVPQVPTATLGFAEGGSFSVPGSSGGDKPALLVGLSAGERVDITPAGRANRNSGGGGAVMVVNNIQSSRDFDVQQTEREGPDGQRIIEQTFSEVMKRIGRGDGDGTFGARFGVRPRTVQR